MCSCVHLLLCKPHRECLIIFPRQSGSFLSSCSISICPRICYVFGPETHSSLDKLFVIIRETSQSVRCPSQTGRQSSSTALSRVRTRDLQRALRRPINLTPRWNWDCRESRVSNRPAASAHPNVTINLLRENPEELQSFFLFFIFLKS